MRHFVPLATLSVDGLVTAFIDRVWSLHGLPERIVSDRGTQFVSGFWRRLSRRLQTLLNHSSAFHPETDGQTERVNAAVEQYLRLFTSFRQDDWVDWLPLAEFSQNNQDSSTTAVSPFYANYGFHPRLGVEPASPLPPLSDQTRREVLRADAIADRFSAIHERLKGMAQESIAAFENNANASRTDAPRFQVGGKVFVSTQHMVTNQPLKKCDDKYAGPFTVLDVYPRACRLDLPPNMKIFSVFHTSKLKLAPTDGLAGQDLINAEEARDLRGRVLERNDNEEIRESWELDTILDAKMKQHGKAWRLMYLVKWKHHEPSWQLAADLKGNEELLRQLHSAHPEWPPPRRWAKGIGGRSIEQPTPRNTGDGV